MYLGNYIVCTQTPALFNDAALCRLIHPNPSSSEELPKHRTTDRCTPVSYKLRLTSTTAAHRYLPAHGAVERALCRAPATLACARPPPSNDQCHARC